MMRTLMGPPPPPAWRGSRSLEALQSPPFTVLQNNFRFTTLTISPQELLCGTLAKKKALDNIMTPRTRPHTAGAAAAAVFSFLKCHEASGIYKARQMSLEAPNTW
ncbi:hypothetical protein E2C01_050405 [Portunus trituberculatus]|uniref:Uncharacterized protein n=1 Tax=Portunus trituberculatus TaxID=210409 RepID=A0A5B7GIV2_PORTR|nr:hypothetical protein [Portunus trituberculatus]